MATRMVDRPALFRGEAIKSTACMGMETDTTCMGAEECAESGEPRSHTQIPQQV
jgi:hypothetical protein